MCMSNDVIMGIFWGNPLQPETSHLHEIIMFTMLHVHVCACMCVGVCVHVWGVLPSTIHPPSTHPPPPKLQAAQITKIQ